MPQTKVELTQLLQNASRGDRGAVDALFSAMEPQLRALAQGCLRQERRDHTLQATALVNEAYLKLVGEVGSKWSNRVQFMAVAAQIFRRILVDHARGHGRDKRGGGRLRVTLDGTMPEPKCDPDVLALHEALDSLSELHPLQARIVELRYFGGLTVQEVSEVLDAPKRTVERHWEFARVWLKAKLVEENEVSDA